MPITPINDTTYEAILTGGDKVEIGDIESPVFKPHLKLKRWGEECWLKVGIAGEIEEELEVEVEPNKLKYKYKVTQNGFEIELDSELYPLESRTVIAKDKEGNDASFTQNEPGGFEFEIILKKKPKTNKIVLDFEMQGLVSYYQPPLTQEFKSGYSEEFQRDILVSETQVTNALTGDVLVERPINVVGSYAVYHATRTNMHRTKKDAEKYKCGKAFHIYRPKVIDALGKTAWASLNISESTFTITIDQTWLDTAIYPVTIDPEFGYHPAAPATSYQLLNCIAMAGAAFTHTATTGDTITSFSIYGRVLAGENGYDLAAYSVVATLPSARLAAGITILLPIGPAAWTDSEAVSQEMSNGVVYCVAFGNSGVQSNAYYDTGAGNNRSVDLLSPPLALPLTWTHDNWGTTRWGIYCTYEVGGVGGIGNKSALMGAKMIGHKMI